VRDLARPGSKVESITIAVSGAAVMIGSVLPWAYAKSFTISPGQNPDELHAVTGGDFDGEVAFALGAIAIVLALVTHYRLSIPVRLITVAVFVWAAGIALLTMDLLSPSPRHLLPDDFNVVPGYGFGLIITLVAAVGGTLVSLAWLIRSQIRTS
jgi:hypothetical protein